MQQPLERQSQASATAGLLHSKQLVLCVGCGGVGKTTTAAALAVAAAYLGRKAAVITVDPAQRLRTALGLDRLSHTPHAVWLARNHGTFDALSLDTKRMFDELVERFAPNPETAQRIFANRLYRELSNELAGSAEYMAMERLYDLLKQRVYDIVIVDTPPSAHIQDLLAAPNRLLSLLASRAVRILQRPTSLVEGASSRAAQAALRTLLRALERWSGLPLLKDLSDFVSGFESMLAGFAHRARDIAHLLRAPTTAFVLVTTPEPRTLNIAREFAGELANGGYPLAGVVANRVHLFSGKATARARTAGSLARRLEQNYRALLARSERDQRLLGELLRDTGLPLLAIVPVQPTPPASLDTLEDIAAHLLAPAAHDMKEAEGTRSRDQRGASTS
ncbi:MAG: anion transporter [Candidatus Binatia bacterium]|nr:MAG: anion transporter [Candidatus Binatia bacterium]